MTISRLHPVSRTYHFTPRLAALIELKYGHDADQHIARAVINDLQLPRVLVVRSSHAEFNAGMTADPVDALIDVTMPSLIRMLTQLNRVTGCDHQLICVPVEHVDKVSEGDRLYSIYSDNDQAIALLDELTSEIRSMEYIG